MQGYFLEALLIMLKGMISIFVVIGLIILVIYLLNKFTSESPVNKKE